MLIRNRDHSRHIHRWTIISRKHFISNNIFTIRLLLEPFRVACSPLLAHTIHFKIRWFHSTIHSDTKCCWCDSAGEFVFFAVFGANKVYSAKYCTSSIAFPLHELSPSPGNRDLLQPAGTSFPLYLRRTIGEKKVLGPLRLWNVNFKDFPTNFLLQFPFPLPMKNWLGIPTHSYGSPLWNSTRASTFPFPQSSAILLSRKFLHNTVRKLPSSLSWRVSRPTTTTPSWSLLPPVSTHPSSQRSEVATTQKFATCNPENRSRIHLKFDMALPRALLGSLLRTSRRSSLANLLGNLEKLVVELPATSYE